MLPPRGEQKGRECEQENGAEADQRREGWNQALVRHVGRGWQKNHEEERHGGRGQDEVIRRLPACPLISRAVAAAVPPSVEGLGILHRSFEGRQQERNEEGGGRSPAAALAAEAAPVRLVSAPLNETTVTAPV